jgi:hypothetical protein
MCNNYYHVIVVADIASLNNYYYVINRTYDRSQTKQNLNLLKPPLPQVQFQLGCNHTYLIIMW